MGLNAPIKNQFQPKVKPSRRDWRDSHTTGHRNANVNSIAAHVSQAFSAG
jgi:hypothetical protein